jgi:DNA-binding response OmpR family regulator
MILIVDDSLTVRMDLQETLSAAGLEATSCANIADARVALATDHYGVVILDVLLPDGDGLELLKEIRDGRATRETAVILLSTEAEVRDRVRGLQTGANEYVGKPYDAAFLIARIRELLRRGQVVTETDVETILLIDDSVTFREALRAALEGVGYRVLVAGSGDEGLSIAATQRPTVIIVDGVMPGEDGISVIRRIRLDAALRSTPCLLLTGSEDERAELRALDAGADAFVRKDEEIEVILARLAALIRRADPGLSRPGAASLHAPKRILAVDDSETYLQAVAEAMRGSGYDLVMARSGEEALEMLAVQPVDCILLDLIMPKIGGEEVCRRIKSAPTLRNTPVIILTSLEDRDVMIRGLGAGADDYIAKSSDFEVLRARVVAQMRRKQFEDENRSFRDQLLRKELDAAEARAARKVAEARAALVDELETRVAERTADLLDSNRRLRAALDAQDEAVNANQAKSHFLAAASHDLRQPLYAMNLFISALRRRVVGDEAARLVVGMAEATESMQVMFNALLDVSRLDAGAVTPNLAGFELEQVLQRLRASFTGAAAAKGLQLTIPPSVEKVESDPVLLESILRNLLSNAVRYTSHGEVGLHCEPHGANVRISVSDTGPGIPDDQREKIFEEFHRLGNGGSNDRGLGLGLSIVRRMATLLEIRVALTSELGSGSAFSIEIPRAVSATIDDGVAAGTSNPLRGRHLLLVEDDPMVREALTREVADWGALPIVAGSAEEALSLLATPGQPRPAIAIVDRDLGGSVDGPALLDLLRDRMHLAIPALIVTGATDPATIEALRQSGYRWVTKPIDAEYLERTVGELLTSARESAVLSDPGIDVQSNHV